MCPYPDFSDICIHIHVSTGNANKTTILLGDDWEYFPTLPLSENWWTFLLNEAFFFFFDMIWMPSHSRLIMTGLSVCSEMTSRKHPYFLMSSLLHSSLLVFFSAICTINNHRKSAVNMCWINCLNELF